LLPGFSGTDLPQAERNVADGQLQRQKSNNAGAIQSKNPHDLVVKERDWFSLQLLFKFKFKFNKEE